jgi:hypothetical protein
MEPRMKTLVLAGLFLLACAFALGFWTKGFLIVDSCLDRGGRWNAETLSCEGLVSD